MFLHCITSTDFTFVCLYAISSFSPSSFVTLLLMNLLLSLYVYCVYCRACIFLPSRCFCVTFLLLFIIIFPYFFPFLAGVTFPQVKGIIIIFAWVCVCCDMLYVSFLLFFIILFPLFTSFLAGVAFSQVKV